MAPPLSTSRSSRPISSSADDDIDIDIDIDIDSPPIGGNDNNGISTATAMSGTTGSSTTPSTTPSTNPLLRENPLLSPLEQEVLDEYTRLLGNMNKLSDSLAYLSTRPAAETLDALRLLERKTATVCTLLKASVYSIVLQQQIYNGEGADQGGGGDGGAGGNAEYEGNEHERGHGKEGGGYGYDDGN
ncbi:hypothetical protein PABG_04887 [Paracoccidioides brasiliensis Pb03]|uniref:DASH complex subunit DAD3 n=1 Tax=Paracoccidioides brasiliensis TaxID=121759 RepID=A0A1D2J7I6_PARBR|nr:hypothetical protein PABG_04887 [Paracoccidioides brasiliensis Pb03]ODH15185.1 hypothetical protein ACO22_06466 [Paracoccidioides brasiliensis]ODH47828.1 hypothetical protein GX48_06094 [Paracoccidioides brasiliensis]